MYGSDSSDSWWRFLREPRWAVPLAVLALAGLVTAAVVVIRNTSRVTVGEAPITLGPVPRDTLMRRAQQKFRRGLVRLEQRLAGYRQEAESLTTRAARLGRFCDSTMEELRVQSARFETTATAARRREYFATVNQTYVALRDSVNAFGREIGSLSAGPDIDSLDSVFERLLSE